MPNKTSSNRGKSPQRPLCSGKKTPKNDSMLNAFVYDTTALQDRLFQRAMAEGKAHTTGDLLRSLSKKDALEATRSFDEPRLAELRAKLEELDAVIGGGNPKGSGSKTDARGHRHNARRVSESDAFKCQPNGPSERQSRRQSNPDVRAENTLGKTGPRRRETY